MKNRETKAKDLAALTESLQNSTSAMVVSFTKLTVSKDQEFRKSLREAGAKYQVVKNTLARIAVKGVVDNCCLNSGQTCTAHTRLLVPAARYAEAARIAVDAARAYRPGDPMAAETSLGPLASKMQQDRVRAYIAKGIAEGCELLTGGTELPDGVNPAGYYVAPTVFGRVSPASTIAQEEIFGPVLSIITYTDENDAIRIANGTVYGLAGGVWSATDEHAERIARRLRTGQVAINGGPFNLYAPFGGYKQSGNGRELGKYGLEEFLEYKAMQFRSAPKA